MVNETRKKNWALKIAGIIFIILSVSGLFLYNNFNRLLSEALHNSFKSNIVSDVYELKFDDLSVNLFDGDIKVYNVVIAPLAKPLHNYPYINSTVLLAAKKLELENVKIIRLLKSGILELDKIEIDKPEIELYITSKLPVFFPFNDSTITVNPAAKKKFISAFSLKEFSLVDASIQIVNRAKEREFNIYKLNISIVDLFIDQHSGKDIFTNKLIELSIGEASGSLQKDAVRKVSLKEFKIKIDSIQFTKTIDTIIYQFSDINSGFDKLNIQTADSTFHLALDSFRISYRQKLVQLKNLVFKPNVSYDVVQHKYKFQHTQFAVTAGSLFIKQINFDSLIYNHKLLIDEISLDRVNANIYKDKTKPIDKKRFPNYFGQQIMSIPIPIWIKLINATNVNLVNTERKPDSSYAKVNINRGSVSIKNITNLSSGRKLEMSANAFIENRAHAFLSLGFDYTKPEFSIHGNVKSFKFPDINPLLQSYTPAKITKGTADEISFSGMIYRTNSTGTFKFLYHDLEVDLELKNQAKWKSSAIAFVANTGLNSGNPVSSDQPPRIVKFKAERDMNKGFFNIIIRSILSGFKETMFMSKENRKAHNKSKQEFKHNKNK